MFTGGGGFAPAGLPVVVDLNGLVFAVGEGRFALGQQGLQFIALVDQRREATLMWLHISALAPDLFRRKTGALPAPEDPLADVPQVKIRKRMRLLPPKGDE